MTGVVEETAQPPREAMVAGEPSCRAGVSPAPGRLTARQGAFRGEGVAQEAVTGDQ
ncbi:hypothetical protein GCM10009665_00940 [Kitasatospora nipponensis]|uniref:Uncharacterized protein n=1 Tax=Kitasatospora nipponensis TaxID=258049 RepID=A0ABP4GDT7_9ACTN